jgi:predicted enzyme related to lactoylglutathione lyase
MDMKRELMQRTYPEGVTSWVDLVLPDVDAAARFYTGLFGWTYADVDKDAPPPRSLCARIDGQDVAGIVEGPETTWRTYVAVDDAEQVLARVATAGGRVDTPPASVGSDGRWAACTDPHGVRFWLWEAGDRPGAQVVNTPGAWNFSDLHAADPRASAAFYSDVFAWEITDMGFGAMIRRPGYGDHLAATVDPGIHERQSGVQTPPGFADAVGWLVPVGPEENPHWHVTFTVADRDETASTVTRLGGTVLRTADTEWTRDALVRDPQGAIFTASQFTPPTG